MSAAAEPRFGRVELEPGIGLGTAALALRRGRETIERVFDAAAEEGVTHFDTAPMYGLGQAEELLGDFIRTRRESVTVTTKVGLLPPPALAARVLPARFLRGPLALARPDYRLATARASFERSLRRLRTDHVDLLLLHECTPEQASDELVGFLADCVSAGTARAAGLATSAESTASIAAARAPFPPVVNLAFDPAEPAELPDAASVITHSSVLPVLVRAAGLAPAELGRWSAELGVDCGSEDVLAGLALAAALSSPRSHIALFASRRPERVTATCRNARLYAGEPGRLERFRALLAERAAAS